MFTLTLVGKKNEEVARRSPAQLYATVDGAESAVGDWLEEYGFDNTAAVFVYALGTAALVGTVPVRSTTAARWLSCPSAFVAPAMPAP